MPHLLLNAAGLFGKKSTAKVGPYTVQLADENDQKHQAMGQVVGLNLHWSAGRRVTAWNGYHGGVAASPDGKVPIIVKCLNWDEKGKHLWARNSSYWGFALFGFREAVWTQDRRVPYAGPDAATPEMLEAFAVQLAEVCAWKRIDPRGHHQAPAMRRVGDSLVVIPGKFVRVPNISDHKVFAELDGYKADRGDIAAYYPKVVTRTCELYDELKAGHRKFETLELLK